MTTIFFIFSLLLFSNNIKTQTIYDHEYVLLKDAIKKHDTTKLGEFFYDWHQESKSLEQSNYKEFPLIRKNVYALFKNFYYPKGLSVEDIPNEMKELYNDPDTLEALFLPYKNTEYIVIQSQIYFRIARNFLRALTKNDFEIRQEMLSIDSVMSFYPPIEIGNKKNSLSDRKI